MMIVKCACGCGRTFSPSRSTQWRIKTGKTPGFISGHGQKREMHGLWKGGQSRTSSGYALVRRASGYSLAHRLVMEQFLGRTLEPWEIVHHINENKTDNRPENLALVTRSSHMAHHQSRRRYDPAPITCRVCDHCGREYVVPSKKIKTSKFCSYGCARSSVPNGETHHKAKLTADGVRSIRSRCANGEQIKAIAKETGLSISAIWMAAKRKTWKHIP